MVKKIFCYITIIASLNTYGQELMYTVNGKQTKYIDNTKDLLLISKSCLHENGKLSCFAFAAISNFKTDNLKKNRPAKKQYGGINPGSFVCRTILKNRVVIGTDTKGNQQSFCLFEEDKSMVSLGSLAYYYQMD